VAASVRLSIQCKKLTAPEPSAVGTPFAQAGPMAPLTRKLPVLSLGLALLFFAVSALAQQAAPAAPTVLQNRNSAAREDEPSRTRAPATATAPAANVAAAPASEPAPAAVSSAAPAPVSSAAPAPKFLTVPVCQWGDCAALCQEVCPAGSVCGTDGICVQIVEPRDIGREIAEAEADRRDAIRSINQRQRARYWRRLSLGGGLGGVSMDNNLKKAGMFVAHVGFRRQLTERVGIHAQLIGTLGLRIVEDATGNSKQLTLSEAEGSISPIFGPFERFYIGPALLLGYRWYSNAFVQWLAPTESVQNHVVREGGLRLGILAGNEEQFDITALLTSSFDKDTPQRCLVSFAYEFR